MKRNIVKKIIPCVILISLLSSTNVLVASGNDFKKLNIDNLSFKQEIEIPFDTSLPEAKYQPVDTRIVFENPCWGKDKDTHSIRVGFDDGNEINELESQVYDINLNGGSQICECSIVFLIPPEANGKEKYYVFYDSKETDFPHYKDHITVEDTHYFYEPISGQKIDVDYYGIWDDESVIYSIVQKGELLGNPVSQGVLKFKLGSKVVETYNIDQLGVFDMRYGIKAQPGYIGSSWATSVKKSILVDGNLMTRVRIEGTSPDGDIKTDNIFTYYHSPIEKRRIFVDVNHEVLKDVDVEEPSILDGTYGGIVSIKSRSNTIEKMNVGEILPKIYLYDEGNNIDIFDVPQNPSTVEREVVLSTQDDIDLGKNSWICLKDESTGKTHGIILDRNSGFGESDDGVQVKAWVKENIKLPGLEADTGNLYVARDSYDIGNKHNKNLKKGFNVNYKAVFITLENESYETIDKESEIYKKLIQMFPKIKENKIEDGEEIERFSLKCYVHMAPSIPLGSLLSAATGKKMPYIYAEIYKENSFKSSGSVGRLALRSVDINLKNKTLIEKVKTIFGIFDIKNSSFFKKIVFPDLEEGKYLVKIFRENPIVGEERKYIGYAIVDVKEDSAVHIYCKPEAKSYFTILDQDQRGIAEAKVQLLQNDVIISDGFTDKNGSVILNAPSQPRNPYTLKIIYKGFLLKEKQIKLGIINHFKEYVDSFFTNLYDLSVTIKDTWDLAPAVDVNPKITSSEMFESVSILGDKTKEGTYIFRDLIPANYVIRFRYKSFEFEDEINLKNNKNVEFKLPAEYKINLDIKNSFGMDLADKGNVIVSRLSKTISADIDKNGKASFMVPPGDYKIDVVIDDKTVASQDTAVRGRKNLDIITNKDSFLHSAITYLGILIILFSAIFMFWKKKYNVGLKLIVIGLLIVALVSPWWVLDGNNGAINTSTKTLLIPPKIVSQTSSDSIIGGQISQVPDEVTMVLNLLSILIVLCCILIFISIFIRNRFKRTTKIVSALSFVILILSVLIFFYTMSQITMIGVGNFMGSGEVDVTLPGLVESKSIPSSWGPGIGFYLSIIVIAVLVAIFLLKKHFFNIICD